MAFYFVEDVISQYTKKTKIMKNLGTTNGMRIFIGW
jgi:hypothetical protein